MKLEDFEQELQIIRAAGFNPIGIISGIVYHSFVFKSILEAAQAYKLLGDVIPCRAWQGFTEISETDFDNIIWLNEQNNNKMKEKSLEELEQLVILWAAEKGILSKATPYKQAQKTLEEVGELLFALGKEDRDEIRDSVGDSVITLIIQAKMQDMTLAECLGAAYDVIKGRQGVMKDGQFVKNN